MGWVTGAWAEDAWFGTAWADQGAPPPAPEPSADTPAGRAKRRRRYIVEIDGREFEVSSLDEVEALLQRAKRVVEDLEAEEAKPKRVVRAGQMMPKPVISTPDPEIQSLVSTYRDDIEAIYSRISMDFEKRQRMRRAMREDEEDAITVLMM